MRPAPFVYSEPRSVDEALTQLHGDDDQVAVLAGGQVLIADLRLRRRSVDRVVDINGLDELSYVRSDPDSIRIGALTRQRDVALSQSVQQHASLVAKALAHGFESVQVRGTFGGAAVEGAAGGDLGPVLMALGAQFTIRSSRAGAVDVSAADFYGAGRTQPTHATDELLVEVRLPKEEDALTAYERTSGGVGSWRAEVSVALAVWLRMGRIVQARVCIGEEGALPTLVEDATTILSGMTLAEAQARDVVEQIARNYRPAAEGLTTRYRERVAGILIKRALFGAGREG